jgi:hypothetical protein
LHGNFEHKTPRLATNAVLLSSLNVDCSEEDIPAIEICVHPAHLASPQWPWVVEVTVPSIKTTPRSVSAGPCSTVSFHRQAMQREAMQLSPNSAFVSSRPLDAIGHHFCFASSSVMD